MCQTGQRIASLHGLNLLCVPETRILDLGASQLTPPKRLSILSLAFVRPGGSDTVVVTFASFSCVVHDTLLGFEAQIPPASSPAELL